MEMRPFVNKKEFLEKSDFSAKVISLEVNLIVVRHIAREENLPC